MGYVRLLETVKLKRKVVDYWHWVGIRIGHFGQLGYDIGFFLAEGYF